MRNYKYNDPCIQNYALLIERNKITIQEVYDALLYFFPEPSCGKSGFMTKKGLSGYYDALSKLSLISSLFLKELS